MRKLIESVGRESSGQVVLVGFLGLTTNVILLVVIYRLTLGGF